MRTGRVRRTVLRLPIVAAALCASAAALSPAARAQWGLMPRSLDLSETVYLDMAGSTARTHLEQVKRFVAENHYSDALDALLQVADVSGDQLVEIEKSRFVSLRRFAQIQISQFAPEGLALYRSRVDAQAEHWYLQGYATRDERLLRRITETAFCSSRGDDALLTLGEIALEQGRPAKARSIWQRILPREPVEGIHETSLHYPDTDLAPAAIRARIVLASILEGSLTRAEEQLAELADMHPDASGRLAGREGNFVAVLSVLLDDSLGWPATRSGNAWTTFAGSPTRNKLQSFAFDIGPVAWKKKARLPASLSSHRRVAVNFGCRPRRVAEDHEKPLSYHPLVKDNLLLVAASDKILALDLHSGAPAWGRTTAVIHQAEKDEPARRRGNSNSSLGAARFTMTLDGDRLYARLGSPVTVSASVGRPRAFEPSRLVCLDLAAQGRLVWEIRPEDKRWAFDGTPLSDGKHIYVAMRLNEPGPQPQAYVACYDATSAKLVWRTFVCRAETLGHGYVSEISHNLITLVDGTIYINSNLGAVASLDAGDGRVNWITLYPRAKQDDLNATAAHFYRDLNPCLYHQGKLLVAPADCREILALEADSGQVLWKTHHDNAVVHLLGAKGGSLIASGDWLWWIDLDTGKVLSWWPDGPSPKGYGRGVVSGDRVYWPTRTEIFVFDLDPRPTRNQHPIAKIPLANQFNTTGGNLLVTDDYLLISDGDSITAFVQFASREGARQDEVAVRSGSTGGIPSLEAKIPSGTSRGASGVKTESSTAPPGTQIPETRQSAHKRFRKTNSSLLQKKRESNS